MDPPRSNRRPRQPPHASYLNPNTPPTTMPQEATHLTASDQAQWRFADPIEDQIKANDFAAGQPGLFLSDSIDVITADDIHQVRQQRLKNTQSDPTSHIQLLPTGTSPRPSTVKYPSGPKTPPPAAPPSARASGARLDWTTINSPADTEAQQHSATATWTTPPPLQDQDHHAAHLAPEEGGGEGGEEGGEEGGKEGGEGGEKGGKGGGEEDTALLSATLDSLLTLQSDLQTKLDRRVARQRYAETQIARTEAELQAVTAELDELIATHPDVAR